MRNNGVLPNMLFVLTVSPSAKMGYTDYHGMNCTYFNYIHKNYNTFTQWTSEGELTQCHFVYIGKRGRDLTRVICGEVKDFNRREK